jgi:predicted metal-dependent hydrolase
MADIQPIVLTMDGIGEVSFVRNHNSSNLRISLHSGQKIRVNVPAVVPMDCAIKFVEEKRDWIVKNSKRIAEKAGKVTVFRNDTLFQTREHTLYLHLHDEKKIRIFIKSGGIHVFYPSFASVEDQRIQSAIRRGIIEAWRLEAAKYLPERVRDLASRYGFSYNKLIFRNNKSRWGSCSRENNISLHIQLMRLPQHLTDYIILHELVHTVHKNHGSQYWQLLEKVTGGNAKKQDKELNGYRLEIW